MNASKKQKTKYWNQAEELIKKHEAIAVVLLLVFSSLLLSGPQYARYKQGSHNSEKEAYYHTMIIEKISSQENPFVFQNDLIYNGKKEATTPYHIVIAEISKTSFLRRTGINLIETIFLWILSLTTLLLFYLILRNRAFFSFDTKTAVIACLLLITSPIFMQIFSSPGPYALIVAITIAGIFLLLKKNNASQYFAAALFMSMPLFGIFYAIITLIILLAIAFSSKGRRKEIFAIIALVSIITLGHSMLLYQNNIAPEFGLQQYPQFMQRNEVKETLSEVGGRFGFSIFVLMLAAIGTAQVWSKKKQVSLYIIIFSALIFSIFFNSTINIYLNFAIMALAAIGLLGVAFAKWQSDFIKNATLLVILCGILFATVSYIHNTAKEIPSVNTIDALDFIKHNTKPGSVVLTHYSNGFLVESASQRKVMTDMHTDISKEEFQKINSIFYLRRTDQIRQKLNEYGIKYIFVTDDMKNGLVWSREHEGILFILKNDPEDFSQMYWSDTAEVWEFRST